METKQSARELLKECREVLLRGQADEQMAMVAGIDLFLAAPSESAMEILMTIRKTHIEYKPTTSETRMALPKDYKMYFDLTDTEAAALIEGYGRRVPRAMLEEIYNLGYQQANDETYGYDDEKETIDSFAKEHGVVIE